MRTILETIFGVANVIIPRMGPRVVPVTLDFSANNQIEVDGTLAYQGGKIDVVQGVFIDNADNADPIEIFVETTQQRLKIKGKTQGYFPLITVNPPVMTFKTPSGANKKVRAIFYNVPIQGENWPSE